MRTNESPDEEDEDDKLEEKEEDGGVADVEGWNSGFNGKITPVIYKQHFPCMIIDELGPACRI